MRAILNNKLHNCTVEFFFNIFLRGAFFLLPFGVNVSIPVFVAGILAGSIIVVRSWNIETIKKNYDVLLFPIYFFLLGSSLFYSTNLHDGYLLLESSLSMLFFPIILLFTNLDKKNVRSIFISLLLGILSTLLFNIFHAIRNSILISNGQSKFDPSIEGGYSFYESFSHGGSYFIGGNFSSLLHPSYVSLYILVLIVYFFKNKIPYRKFVLFFLFLYLFLLSSRSALFILILTYNIYLFTILKKSNYKYIVALLTLEVVFIFFNPRVQVLYDRLVDFSTKENYNYTTSEQSRLLSWDASISLIRDQPLLGYGVGDANDILIERYKKLNYNYNYNNRYNAHNQFLQTYLEMGILGFGLLLSIFLLLIGQYKNRSYEVYIILVLFLSLFFESMLFRFNGIVFYSIIIPLLYLRKI